MSIGSWLRSRFSPRAQGSVELSRPDWLIRHPWLREAGVMVTGETALEVSAVYGCLRLISDSIASQPVRVYELTGSGRREILWDDQTAWILNYGARLDLLPDAPTAQAIEECLLMNSLIWGNAYAEIQRDGAGRVVALWPMESERVTPRRDETGFWYEIQQPQGGVARLEALDVIHVRGPSLYGLVGDSVVYRAAKAIGLAGAAQLYASAYFANGSVLAGVLKSPGKLSDEQKKRFGEGWRTNFSGAGKQFATPILDQGLDYQPINHDAAKSQLTEGRKMSVAEIARYFGVPLTLLGENEAWTNLSELYLGFYRTALKPISSRIDAEFTRKLFPQRQPWREVEHDLTSIVLGSFKDQVAALAQAVNEGLKTRNEARAILGDNSLGADGDVLVVGSAVKRLEDVLEPPEPAAAVSPPGREAPGAESSDEEDDTEDATDAVDVARIAVALDRFERRVSAQSADIARKNPPDIIEAMEAARRKHGSTLVETCRVVAPGLDEERILRVANSVMEGEPPHLAAARLLEAVVRAKVDPVGALAASVAQLAGVVAAKPALAAPVVNVTAPPALTPEAARALGEGLRPEPSPSPKARTLTYQRDEKGRVLGMKLEN